MVQFDKLRLSGFKSFVDPTELAIEPGMTGIVGPNGCGKSNLVEALKWVMGETSAKQMRGSEMEDVIFAGAGTRPARNIAEVMLTLDNKTRTAPAMVNDTDQLDIVAASSAATARPIRSMARRSAPATCRRCSPMPPRDRVRPRW
jgi:chromosome segregation protein